MISIARALGLCAALALLPGCASNISQWIVETRDRQGDVAIKDGNLEEAALAYKLALEVDPTDPRARAGAVTVQVALAQNLFRNGKLDDAFDALAAAEKVDPKNGRVLDLREELEQAKLKREIVLSNYPTQRDIGLQIRRNYEQLAATNANIIRDLKRFGYTYDTADLARAIRSSYDLGSEVTKNTNRLITYRQLVESGVPDASKAAEPLAPPASLLPLP